MTYPTSFKYHPDYDSSTDSPHACRGELCPQCMKTNKEVEIKLVGSNPDGMNMNNAYDCMNCGAQWEGY